MQVYNLRIGIAGKLEDIVDINVARNEDALAEARRMAAEYSSRWPSREVEVLAPGPDGQLIWTVTIHGFN